MSALLDSLLTPEQRASCAQYDAQPIVSGVMPLDTSRFPDSCAFEGAAPVVSYDAGRVIRESEREFRGYWWALPVVGLLSILAAWWQFGGGL